MDTDLAIWESFINILGESSEWNLNLKGMCAAKYRLMLKDHKAVDSVTW